MSGVKWLAILIVVILLGLAAPRTQAATGGGGGAQYVLYMPAVLVARPAAVARQTVMAQVWHDVNGNGVRDEGESAIAGVPISVTNVSPTPTPTSGSMARATDANGTAMFSLISGSSYILESWHNQTQWRATTETRFTLATPPTQVAYHIGLQPR